MLFRVIRVKGAPEFDALPVAKISHYPLEKADYKPYAHCVVCLTDYSLELRMLAFEVNTSDKSELRAVFYLFPDEPEKALHIKAAPAETSGTDNVTTVWTEIRGSTQPLLGVKSVPHNGEDLQGVYWGCDISLPLSTVKEGFSLKEGDRFPGNFYKIRTGERFEHYGSWATADIPQNPFVRDSMGELQIVGY